MYLMLRLASENTSLLFKIAKVQTRPTSAGFCRLYDVDYNAEFCSLKTEAGDAMTDTALRRYFIRGLRNLTRQL
jgi:hypothetical protein